MRLLRLASLCTAALLAGLAALPAQTFRVLHTFDAGSEGIHNTSPLAVGPDGRLYGTNLSGGKYSQGTVFSFRPDGSDYRVLRHMSYLDGESASYGGVIVGQDGRLYGTTYNGGGTVFAMNREGTDYTVLHSFSSVTGYIGGSTPYAGLIQGSDGRLYGVTSQNGTFHQGALFALQPDGSGFTVLRHFDGTNDGSTPRGTLLQASDGWIYGTTTSGGTHGAGTIFKVGTNGANFTVLKHLEAATDGGTPYAGLTEGPAGRLFGVCRVGGVANFGTLFSLNADGSDYRVLVNFRGNVGFWPEGRLLRGADGRLYGTTAFQSVNKVFAVNPDGTGFTILHSLNHLYEGANVVAGLTQTGNGRLYGVAQTGGVYQGGTLFSLNADGSGFQVLRQSDYRATGKHPSGRLLEIGGKLFGTTSAGAFDQDGTSYEPPRAIQFGTMFSVHLDGTNFSVLRNLVAPTWYGGLQPRSGLVGTSNGYLWGMSGSGGSGGGRGTVFATNASATFHGGLGLYFPYGVAGGELAVGPDGRLYGLAPNSEVFALDPVSGIRTTLRTLTSDEGYIGDYSGMYLGLIAASDGRLYGMASHSGLNGGGTVFGLNTDGTGFSVIRHLGGGKNGYFPFAGLVEGSDGRLYGTTYYGGVAGGGTVFGIDKDGANFALLADLIYQGPSTLYGPSTTLVEGLDGRLYGAAARGGALNGGTLFSVSKAGGDIRPEHEFDPTRDGRADGVRLMRASNGVIYGVSPGGGPFYESGTIFSFTITPPVAPPVAPPVITSAPTAVATVAQPFAYTITATNSPTDFDALNLPPNLAVNHATGLISGLPQQAGQFLIDLAAANAGGTGLGQLALTVAAPPPVPVNVTASLQITRGGFRLVRATGRYVQTVTVRNIGPQPIAGPLSLVLDALSPTATLHAPAGTTTALAPLGSPYVNLNLGADAALTPGESVSANLEFVNPTNQSIAYLVRALAGPGAR
jgi:uncharacterized repeat protein (TIGR03803 family)